MSLRPESKLGGRLRRGLFVGLLAAILAFSVYDPGSPGRGSGNLDLRLGLLAKRPAPALRS